MDWDRISGNWAWWRERIQERWCRLTADHLDLIAGHREQLAGRIQEVYGTQQHGSRTAAAQLGTQSGRGRVRRDGPGAGRRRRRHRHERTGVAMLTLNGIRNGLWCTVAFGIVACASTPMPVEKLAVAKTSVERAEQAQAAQFAQVELNTARNKLAAAQAAVDDNGRRTRGAHGRPGRSRRAARRIHGARQTTGTTGHGNGGFAAGPAQGNATQRLGCEHTAAPDSTASNEEGIMKGSLLTMLAASGLLTIAGCETRAEGRRPAAAGAQRRRARPRPIRTSPSTPPAISIGRASC